MFSRKLKIKKAVVLDVGSAAHLEAFLIKQGVLSFAHLNQACAEMCMCNRTPHMLKPDWI